ncbi:asparagine synthetase A [Umezawaea tangerina]|uniref:Asparaginyl-tRNA synthetase n=1 Tax=Umezawaea tangerina TaxID=84725 RepID=A0A2T0SVT7_9PSEU|nr:asparagine synthetase A [Umezawaea tangerina]PRY37518.1 asparaginyl-tRNA synthetase [Umezawaea tangerina]
MSTTTDPLPFAATARVVNDLEATLDSPWFRLITRINAELVHASGDFYRARDISPVLMPITVNSVSSPMGLGSDSLPVRIDLFGDPTYLADSMQFQLEFMLRMGLPGAYYIMPTFRGEDPDSSHLNQFFHSEAEIAGGLDDVMRLVEGYVTALCSRLLDSPVADDIADVAGGLDHVVDLAGRTRFPEVTFDEACALVDPEHVEDRGSGVRTITRAGELQLIERFGGVVWLTRMPENAVPFYQAGGGDGTALCADLLLGLGEVAGCGERHTTRADTERAIVGHDVDPADYEWYLRMKELAPLRSAGFGLGLERFLAWVLRHHDIRDMHLMPRLKGVPTWM